MLTKRLAEIGGGLDRLGRQGGVSFTGCAVAPWSARPDVMPARRR
jgi:hypothetical protein